MYFILLLSNSSHHGNRTDGIHLFLFDRYKLSIRTSDNAWRIEVEIDLDILHSIKYMSCQPCACLDKYLRENVLGESFPFSLVLRTGLRILLDQFLIVTFL